jgi:hypothetical protein
LPRRADSDNAGRSGPEAVSVTRRSAHLAYGDLIMHKPELNALLAAYGLSGVVAGHADSAILVERWMFRTKPWAFAASHAA